jgi:tetratricopeptide (TPR) repeat protein
MNVNTDYKLIFKIIIFFFISASTAVIFSLSGPGSLDAGELLDKINPPLDCARVKKRILAALELYAVDNKLPAGARVSVRDIVSARYLKYELACPKGGKYSFTPEMKLECSKCDAPEKNEDAQTTTEVTAFAKPRADATLESKINKYLDIEDIEFLNNPQKSAGPAESSAVALSDTGETGIPKQAAAADADAFKTVPGPDGDGADPGDEEDDDEGPSSGEEQITVKENSNIGKGARDYHNEAIEHARRGEADNAIEKFKKAIELVPDSFTYHYNYGLFLAKVESYDLAYIEFQRATRLDPQNTRVKTMIEKLKKAISTR